MTWIDSETGKHCGSPALTLRDVPPFATGIPYREWIKALPASAHRTPAPQAAVAPSAAPKRKAAKRGSGESYSDLGGESAPL